MCLNKGTYALALIITTQVSVTGTDPRLTIVSSLGRKSRLASGHNISFINMLVNSSRALHSNGFSHGKMDSDLSFSSELSRVTDNSTNHKNSELRLVNESFAWKQSSIHSDKQQRRDRIWRKPIVTLHSTDLKQTQIKTILTHKSRSDRYTSSSLSDA